MKKTFAVALAAVVAVMSGGVVHAGRQYPLCDPAKSTLCSGLVALFKMADSATDTFRYSETGSTRFMDIGRYDVRRAAGGMFGGYATEHQALANDGLYIPRTSPFIGTFTMGFWVNITTLPTAGKGAPILWMCPVADPQEYKPQASCTPSASPVLYIYNNAGTSNVWYAVTQSITETTTYLSSTQVRRDGDLVLRGFRTIPEPRQFAPVSAATVD